MARRAAAELLQHQPRAVALPPERRLAQLDGAAGRQVPRRLEDRAVHIAVAVDRRPAHLAHRRMGAAVDQHAPGGLPPHLLEGDAEQVVQGAGGETFGLHDARAGPEDHHAAVAHKLAADQPAPLRRQAEEVRQQVAAEAREVAARHVAQQVHAVRQARQRQVVRPLAKHREVLEAAGEVLPQRARVVEDHRDGVLAVRVRLREELPPHGHLLGDDLEDVGVVEEAPADVHPVGEEASAGGDGQVAQQPRAALGDGPPGALRGPLVGGPAPRVVLDEDRLAAQDERIADALGLEAEADRPGGVVRRRDEEVQLRQVEHRADVGRAARQQEVAVAHAEPGRLEGVADQPAQHRLLQRVRAGEGRARRRLLDGRQLRPPLHRQRLAQRQEVVAVPRRLAGVRPVQPLPPRGAPFRVRGDLRAGGRPRPEGTPPQVPPEGLRRHGRLVEQAVLDGEVRRALVLPEGHVAQDAPAPRAALDVADDPPCLLGALLRRQRRGVRGLAAALRLARLGVVAVLVRPALRHHRAPPHEEVGVGLDLQDLGGLAVQREVVGAVGLVAELAGPAPEPRREEVVPVVAADDQHEDLHARPGHLAVVLVQVRRIRLAVDGREAPAVGRDEAGPTVDDPQRGGAGGVGAFAGRCGRGNGRDDQ